MGRLNLVENQYRHSRHHEVRARSHRLRRLRCQCRKIPNGRIPLSIRRRQRRSLHVQSQVWLLQELVLPVLRDGSSKGSSNWCYTASKGGAYISCSRDSDCDATWKVSKCKYDSFQKC